MAETVRTALSYGCVIMLFGTAAVFLFADPLMSFFTADPAVIAVGRSYLKISAFILYAYVVLSVNVAALQGIRKPMFALWIGLWRQIVAPVAVFWLLTRLLGIGLAGIWWGIFGITWSAAAVAWLYARRQLKKTLQESA
jgi:Na+-driven multidrug efflux pump